MRWWIERANLSLVKWPNSRRRFSNIRMSSCVTVVGFCQRSTLNKKYSQINFERNMLQYCNLCSPKTRGVWIMTTFRICDYGLHVEHASCVMPTLAQIMACHLFDTKLLFLLILPFRYKAMDGISYVQCSIACLPSIPFHYRITSHQYRSCTDPCRTPYFSVTGIDAIGPMWTVWDLFWRYGLNTFRASPLIPNE